MASSTFPGGGLQQILLQGQVRSKLQGQGKGGTPWGQPVLQSPQGTRPGSQKVSFPQWTSLGLHQKFHGHVTELGDLIQPRPGPGQED